jgi:hypothetical protein
MQKTGTRRLDVLAVREGHEGEFFINYKFEPKLQIKDVDNGYYVKGEDEDIDIGTFEDDGLNEFENW